MSLPLIILILLSIFVGILSISSSIRESRLKKRLSELEASARRKRFEEESYTEMQESLDASIDIPTIVSLLAKQLEIFLPSSTVTSLIVTEQKLLFRTTAFEPVSQGYISDVLEAVHHSLATLENRSFRDVPMTEEVSGKVTDTVAKEPIGSLFHLPLMLHTSVVAIITVTSTKANQFQTEDIATMQRLVMQTAKSISKLDALLQQERGRLQAIASSLKDGLFMVDAHNTLQLINPAAKHLLALHHEPITTMDVLSALPIHFDFRGKIEAALHQNMSSEISGVTLKDKQLRCGIAPVRASTGRTLGVSILMHDETLTNSVPRMKEDFTNIIVHELRNPLTSIKASSELLVSSITFSPEEQRKLNQVIYDQSNKLLTNIQQILDAAKLEAGVFSIQKRTNDLSDVIKHVSETFQKEAQDNMINLLVDVEHHLPAFSFDAKYLSLALTNILSNSMKFTSQGGTVQITAKHKQGKVIITLSDTGAGIPKDKQHKVFNKFSQFEGASATVGKGLGLYMVKGVIEAHGGTIEIDSDRGRGTTIFLTLPLTDASYHSVASKSLDETSQRVVN